MRPPIEAAKNIYRFIRPAFWKRRNPVYTDYDLRRLDFEYWRMYRGHETLHRALTTEIAKFHGGGRVLEVACGTGWNTPNFSGFDYYGLDVSEPAISLALRKYPERRFLNLGIRDASVLQPQSFDIVYNSSMLEHIGYMETALRQMIQLAKRHLYIVFFEGLAESTQIDFHPYSAKELKSKDLYGHKVTRQDHGRVEKGWYWNRYSRKDIEAIVQGMRYEILDHTNRPYFANESVLHVVI